MKKILISLLLLPAMVVLSFTMEDPLPLGSAIPKTENKLKDISGREVTLKDAMKENGLLVMFSCNTCPVVINNQARTKEICQFAAKKSIGVVLLNSNEANRKSSESLNAMQDYAKGQGYNWYYAEDKNNELADAFGATRTPEVFLFDKTGKLVYHGAMDDSPSDAASVKRNHLKEAINETLAGKEVSVKQSKSVGCSIKRIS
ncbi:thioredoxin family protein [Niastella caeni]|uniref:Thioredoxin family protein n=1 Tax=Niastella caeni TaxID=2569763 RepID=A0A4S8HPA7_9BACT|nr:thioredoxin family protein [Niastella caeni]THU34832.1 thioredoxin family protein [Niastella caeni]